jgi:predicted Zn-dependent peptidase
MLRKMTGVALLFASALATAADGFSLPEALRVVLDNGAILIVNEKDDVPLVGIEVLIRGGAVRDQEGKSGTASLFAGLMERGAGDRSAIDIAEAVESVGGELSLAAELESIRIRAEFLSRDLELALTIIGDLVTAPTLDAQELDILKERQINLIRAARDADPGQLLPTYAARFLFEDHPYGNPLAGSEDSLAGITLDDILAFYANEVGADRLIISVSGDVDADSVIEQLTAIFGGFRTAGAALAELPAARRTTTRRVLLVDKPGATQTYFWIGNVAVPIDFDERAELDLANTAFGGRFTSMLNTALRVESGLTYGARSVLTRGSASGSVGISSYTRTEATAQAIDLALNVLYRLRAEGIDASTLESAQNYVLGAFPTRLETARQLAAQFAMLELYGFDAGYVNEYAGAINDVTVDSIAPVISSVYPADDSLVFVIIGDAEAIRDTVARYGQLSEISIAEGNFGLPPQADNQAGD